MATLLNAVTSATTGTGAAFSSAVSVQMILTGSAGSVATVNILSSPDNTTYTVVDTVTLSLPGNGVVGWSTSTSAAYFRADTFNISGTNAAVTVVATAAPSYTLTDGGAGTIIGNTGVETTGVTVNTTLDKASFYVSDIGGTNTAQVILHKHSTTLEPLCLFARANSETSGHTAVAASQKLGTLQATGYSGTSGYQVYGQLSFSVDSTGSISNTSAPGAFQIAVTPNGAVTPINALTINNAGTSTFMPTVAPPVNGNAADGILMSSTAGLGIYFGAGAPNFTAAQGSIYINTTGSTTATRLYVNTTGSTTWTNFTSAA